jgi:type I restriction enzyme S subunit
MSFPKYDNLRNCVEWFGEIPSHWENATLKRVVDPTRQITYGIVQAGPNVEGGVPYIRPADMTDENGVASENEMLKTSKEIAESYSRSMICSGDLVCSIGPSFGKVMVTPDSLNGANLTQGTARVAIHSPNDARYFFWVLRSQPSFSQWESSVGGATFRALNLGPLAATEVLIPPPDEQKMISSFLDTETAKIDALVAEQRRLIELLKEKRQAVISHAVTKGLNPNAPMKDSGIEWVGDVPEHWEIKKLKFLLLESAAGPYGSSLTKAMYTNSGYRVYGQQQVIPDDFTIGDYYISKEKFDSMKRYEVHPSDLLISVMGTVGKVAVVPPDVEPGIINPRLVRYRLRKQLALPRFIQFLIHSPMCQNQLTFAAQGSTMEGLNMLILDNLWIVLPPIEVQSTIVNFALDKTHFYSQLQSEAEKTIELLQERRTALISAAVTGKIDVRE